MEQDTQVVITGIGIVCSLGRDKSKILERMKTGTSSIGPLSSIATAGFISNVGAELEADLRRQLFRTDMDPCAAFAVAAVADALADAKLVEGDYRAAGLVLGTCNGGLISLEEQGSLTAAAQASETARYPFYRQADDVARIHRIGGPVVTINTACAASGNAIGMGFDLLSEGKAEVVIAGGADAMSYSVYAGFNSLQALKDEACSPFAAGPGLSLGEGAAFFVLERRERAIQRGARIYAEVLGYGLSNDGHHATAPDPNGAGVARAITAGLKQAQITPDAIEYVNAHGTGTAANDRAELRGVEAAFAEAKKMPRLSSSKAYFGHNLGAAAAIELATTLICQSEDLVPATINQTTPREGCDKDYIIRAQMPVMPLTTFISNNMAFGGHNCSLVLGRDGASRAPRPLRKNVQCRIAGLGFVGAQQGQSVAALLAGEATVGPVDYQLKEHFPELYERRMNKLSQLTMGSVALCLDAAQLPAADRETELGVVFGTALGSLDATARFIEPIMKNGPGGASSVLFPDLVLNSTAGKIARLLGLKGFASSLSTGGNDGLAAAFYACAGLKAGYARHFLAVGADELSVLEGAVNQAEGIAGPTSESAITIALSTTGNGVPVRGFELGFRSAPEERSSLAAALVVKLLATHQLQADDLSFVLYTASKPEQGQALEAAMAQCCGAVCTSLDGIFGYSRASSSLLHLGLAAEALQMPLPERERLIAKARPGDHAVVIGEAINGGVIVALLGGNP